MGQSVNKGYYEGEYWRLLEDRYPLTWLWWHPDESLPSLFPPWSEEAFLAECDRWQRLSEGSFGAEDEEVEHWARYARWATVRLRLAPPCREPVMALRYANAVWEGLALLDPDAHRYHRPDVAVALIDWLKGLAPASSSTPWHRQWFQGEAEKVRRLTAAQVSDDGLLQELNRILDALDATHEGERTWVSVSWVHSAHVDLDEWRRHKALLDRQPKVVVSRPLDTVDVLSWPKASPLGFSLTHSEHVQGWWIRPSREGDQLVYGPNSGPTLSFGMLLGLWRHRAQRSPLTWALTPPPIIEGGVIAIAIILVRLEFSWAPVTEHWFQYWQQLAEALASADSQLFGEQKDPAEVVAWLSHFTGRSMAERLVPWVFLHPGHYMLAKWAWEYWLGAHEASWDHRLWHQGPLLPYQLFVDPAASVRRNM